jgi:fluoride exporter
MRWHLVSVGLGGALGAVGRYALLQWLGGVDEGVLPWGTFVANVLGSLLLGAVVGVVERGAFGEGLRLFLAVGLLGGFTTFSFYSYENLELLRDDRHLALVVNAGGQVIVGLAGAVIGYLVVIRSRLIPGRGG